MIAGSFDLIAFISDESVAYLPKLNPVAGSKETTILLLRILKWWEWAKYSGRSSFWKFDGPCSHPQYKPGDSWQEELGLTRAELERAKSHICSRIKLGESKEAMLDGDFTGEKERPYRNAVLYYTNAKRVTFYHVNERVIYLLFAAAYPGKRHQTNAEKTHQTIPENQQHSNAENQDYLSYTGDKQHTTSTEVAKPPAGEKKLKPKRKSGTPLVRQLITFKAVTTHLPPTPLREKVIKTIGDAPDVERLKLCYETWLTRGYNKFGMDWLFEWYVNNEIPERQFRGQKSKANGPDGSAERGSSSTNGKTQLRPAKNA